MRLNFLSTSILTCLGIFAMPLLLFSFNNGENGGPNNGSPTSNLLSSATSMAPQPVDFKQAANNDAGYGLGNLHWINSIVHAPNSDYFEGMSNHQRVLFSDIPQTDGNVHVFKFRHQATKGIHHGYDFLTSWDQATAYNMAVLGVGYIMNECGDDIEADFIPVCNSLHGGPYIVDADLPDDPFPGYQQRIDAYEAAYGNRTIRIYADQEIKFVEFCGGPVHDVGNNGDSYIIYNIKVTGNAGENITQLAFEVAGHLAIGGSNTDGLNWGPGMGCGAISGAPWHFKLDGLGGEDPDGGCDPVGGGNIGNQDNQISDIMLPGCPTCSVDGETGPLCPNTETDYTVTIDGNCNGQSDITWTLDPNTSGASFVGGNTGATVTVNCGTNCGSYTLHSTFTCSDCPDPVSCDISATVEDQEDPVIDGCPEDAIGLGCNPEASAHSCDAARSLVTATDNCGGTINWDCDAGEVTENGCYRSQIFTLTASDVCDNSAQCQVTYNWKEDHNAPTFRDCPESAIELGCNPQNLPTCNDALALVGASDNCDGNITPSCEPSDITAIGCKRSQTFTLTATDDCGNHTDCAVTYTWTIDNPPVITCPATLNLLCGQSTAPSVYPTATDDCGAVPTFSYQDVSIPATCGGTAGSAYSRVWTATGGCGLTASCTQTVTCGPCVTVCGLTQGFYGSTNGKFKGYTALEIIHNTLNSSGAMVLGLPGRSLTVNPSAIGCTPTCINSLMPAGGQAAKLPAGNMVLSTGSCCVPNNNTWRKNGKFASVLWGQAVTLWMNAHMDANFGSMTLNHACIAKPALLNGVADVAGLLDFTNKALGGYVFPSLGRELNNSELGILAGYLGDLHNYFDNCKLDCNHYYYDDPHNRPSGGRDQEPEQIETKEIVQVNDFKVVPNPMWDQFTVTLDKESVGKAVSIMVFNQFGQIVLAENQTALSSEEVQLTASKLPAGIYQISVRVENQHPMAKTIVVIKQ